MQSGDKYMLPTKQIRRMTATSIQFGSKMWSALLQSSMQNVMIALRDVTAQIEWSKSPFANFFVGCIDLSIECIVTKLNYGIVLEFMEGSRYWKPMSSGRYLWWCQYSREEMEAVTFVIVQKQWPYTFALVSEVSEVVLKLSFWRNQSEWEIVQGRPTVWLLLYSILLLGAKYIQALQR